MRQDRSFGMLISYVLDLIVVSSFDLPPSLTCFDLSCTSCALFDASASVLCVRMLDNARHAYCDIAGLLVGENPATELVIL